MFDVLFATGGEKDVNSKPLIGAWILMRIDVETELIALAIVTSINCSPTTIN